MQRFPGRKFNIPTAHSDVHEHMHDYAGTHDYAGMHDYAGVHDYAYLDSLLAQYPPSPEIGKLWSMRVHVSMCSECSFMLGPMIPADLRTMLPESLHHMIERTSENMNLLRKWAQSGTPAQVRTIYETVNNCHHYDPPVIPEYVRREQNKQSLRGPRKVERAERAEQAEHAEHAERSERSERPERPPKVYFDESIVGPKDSKYKLQRPEYKPKVEVSMPISAEVVEVAEVAETVEVNEISKKAFKAKNAEAIVIVEPPKKSPKISGIRKTPEIKKVVEIPKVVKTENVSPVVKSEKMEYPGWQEGAYKRERNIDPPENIVPESDWF